MQIILFKPKRVDILFISFHFSIKTCVFIRRALKEKVKKYLDVYLMWSYETNRALHKFSSVSVYFVFF